MTADSLQSRVVKWDNARYHGGNRFADPSMIIIHGTQGDSAKSSIEWLNRPDSDHVASYTYLIDRDGAIIRMTPPKIIAYHAGDSAWPHPKVATATNQKPNGGKSVNAISYGFAFCNREDGEEVTELEMESMLWLCKVYMTLDSIPVELVRGHYEVSPGRKTDPKPAIEMDDFRRRLTEYMAAA